MENSIYIKTKPNPDPFMSGYEKIFAISKSAYFIHTCDECPLDFDPADGNWVGYNKILFVVNNKKNLLFNPKVSDEEVVKALIVAYAISSDKDQSLSKDFNLAEKQEKLNNFIKDLSWEEGEIENLFGIEKFNEFSLLAENKAEKLIKRDLRKNSQKNENVLSL